MSTNEIGPEDHLPDAQDNWIVAYEQHVARGGPAPPDFPEDASREDQRQLGEARRAIEALHGAFGTAGPLPTHTSTLQPEQLGDFRIVREIGRGGMGVVYEAEQLSMGRRVALKILPLATLTDPQGLTRFQNEVRAAGTLDHPHIVPVYAVGEERGVHYFAMQLVRGQSLARVIEQLRRTEPQRGAGSIAAAVHDSDTLAKEVDSSTDRASTSPSADPLQQASTVAARDDETPADHKPRYHEFCRSVAALGVQAAEALDHAHEHGIVHRDVKPSNLLVDGTGRLWVTDFGLARIEADARLTQSRDWVGTLRYMAPEQALGHKSRIDHRVDIYALGATLHELLVLQPARAGDDREALLQQCAQAQLVTLRKIDSRIPAELATIVGKAMEYEPSDRYDTAQELAEDLQRFLNDRPILAHPPTLRQRLAKWSRRHATFVAATLGFLLLLAVTASTAAVLVEQQREKAVENARLETQARLVAERERRQAKALLARIHLERGVTKLNAEDSRGLLNLVDAWMASDESPQLQEATGRLWAVAADAAADRPAQLINGRNGVFSPDGKVLALAQGTAIQFWDVATAQLRGRQLQLEEKVSHLLFSPDGARLAATSDRGVTRLWDMSNWEPVGPVLRDEYDSAGGDFVAFSPDGQLFATGALDGIVRLRDTVSGQPYGDPLRHEQEVSAVEFSPNGKILATGTEAGVVRMWDVASGRLHVPPFPQQQRDDSNDEVPEGTINEVAFSPDGKLLAATFTNGLATLLDVETGRPHKFLAESSWLQDFAFSPDGERVAGAAVDWTVKLWDTQTGRKLKVHMPHDARVRAVAYSPDGKLLASGAGDHTVRLWDAATGAPLGSPIYHDYEVLKLSWSPDDRLLAGSGKETRIWKIDRHNGNPEPPAPRRLPKTVVSPDGRYRAMITKEQTVNLLDTSTGAAADDLLRDDGVKALAFSPDSRLLATGANSHTTKIWEAATGRLRQTLVCEDRVYGIAFSPDGKKLAAGVFDGAVLLWDFANGRQLGLPMRHHGPVWDVAFSPDGNLLASLAGREPDRCRAWIWDLSTGPDYLGLPLAQLSASRWHTLSSFSLDGKLHVTGLDGTPRDWTPPQPPSDLRTMRLQTWVALGLQQNLQGRPEAISAQQWRVFRDELQTKN